jgi:hypothetical protein
VWLNAPVLVPLAAAQLVVGLFDVPQQVPLAVMEAGTPSEVTLAPKVALVCVTEVAVGLESTGTPLAAQVDPFQVVPETQLELTTLDASWDPLLYREKFLLEYGTAKA